MTTNPKFTSFFEKSAAIDEGLDPAPAEVQPGARCAVGDEARLVAGHVEGGAGADHRADDRDAGGA